MRCCIFLGPGEVFGGPLRPPSTPDRTAAAAWEGFIEVLHFSWPRGGVWAALWGREAHRTEGRRKDVLAAWNGCDCLLNVRESVTCLAVLWGRQARWHAGLCHRTGAEECRMSMISIPLWQQRVCIHGRCLAVLRGRQASRAEGPSEMLYSCQFCHSRSAVWLLTPTDKFRIWRGPVYNINNRVSKPATRPLGRVQGL